MSDNAVEDITLKASPSEEPTRETLSDWLKNKDSDLMLDSKHYDNLTLKNRDTANRFDLFLGLFTVLVGANGAAGALTTPWEELSTLAAIIAVVQLTTAVITVYAQVHRPRQKEILYGNASAGNAAVARAARTVRDLGVNVTTEQAVKCIINTLEASFQDDNPLTRQSKSKDN